MCLNLNHFVYRNSISRMDDDYVILILMTIICFSFVTYLYKHLDPKTVTTHKLPSLMTPSFDSTTLPIIRIPLEDRIDFAVDDKHNVHNKTLQRTAFHVIQQLKECDCHHYTQESVILEIMDMIKKKNQDVLENIFRRVLMRDAYYRGGHIKEKELIRLVWERIHHPINREHVLDMEETFLT